MNVLYVIPLVTIAIIGAISMAGIFDFRKRPLQGSMKSPFEGDAASTPVRKLESGRQKPLAALFEAWTREIRPGDHELDALGFHAVSGDSASASCAITRDDELIPEVGRDETERRNTRGLELPLRRV
jgi:hypothetical protein